MKIDLADETKFTSIATETVSVKPREALIIINNVYYNHSLTIILISCCRYDAKGISTSMGRMMCILFDRDNLDHVLGQIWKRNFHGLYVAHLEFPGQRNFGKDHSAMKH